MNTYNVSVNGKQILTEVPAERLEGELKILKSLVWVSGGCNEDIEIVENKS